MRAPGRRGAGSDSRPRNGSSRENRIPLSIAVDDGQTPAVAGDKLAYRLTVTNLGTEAVEDLLVTQTVPAGSKLVAKDSKASESKGIVTWKVDIKPTEKVTLDMSLAVLTTADEVLRLATVALRQGEHEEPPDRLRLRLQPASGRGGSAAAGVDHDRGRVPGDATSGLVRRRGGGHLGRPSRRRARGAHRAGSSRPSPWGE